MADPRERNAKGVAGKEDPQKSLEEVHLDIAKYHEKKLRPDGKTEVTPWKLPHRIDDLKAQAMFSEIVDAGLEMFFVNDPREVLDAVPDFAFINVTDSGFRDFRTKTVELGIGVDWVEDGYDVKYSYGIELDLDKPGHAEAYTGHTDPNTVETRHYTEAISLSPIELGAISHILQKYAPVVA